MIGYGLILESKNGKIRKNEEPSTFRVREDYCNERAPYTTKPQLEIHRKIKI
jgi:hypothetical protein